MKYLILISLLFLAGCEVADDTPALVNVTCYNKSGEITFRHMNTHGPVEIINSKVQGRVSEKCVIERAE